MGNGRISQNWVSTGWKYDKPQRYPVGQMKLTEPPLEPAWTTNTWNASCRFRSCKEPSYLCTWYSPSGHRTGGLPIPTSGKRPMSNHALLPAERKVSLNLLSWKRSLNDFRCGPETRELQDKVSRRCWCAKTHTPHLLSIFENARHRKVRKKIKSETKQECAVKTSKCTSPSSRMRNVGRVRLTAVTLLRVWVIFCFRLAAVLQRN